MINPNVMSPIGYVCQTLMFKEIFHLWDYTQELWGQMNEVQLGALRKEVFKKQEHCWSQLWRLWFIPMEEKG